MDFFAKIGRTPLGKVSMSALGTAVSIGYLSTQLFAHDIVRNFLAAQSPSKKREEFSPELQRLVLDVYEDIKHDFNQPIFQNNLLKLEPGPIKWFSTSWMEPISFGLVEARYGALIGLPNYYSFREKEDLPANVFEIRKFKLFRDFTKKDSQDKEEAAELKAEKIIRLEEESELGKRYSESLILSENAKKFAIAKELFKVDSYRVLMQFALIASSILVSLTLSRRSVTYFKVAEAHLSRRLPYYMLSGAAAYVNYTFLDLQLNEYYDFKTTEKAREISKLYEEGYEEFILKKQQRMEALQEINSPNKQAL